MVRYVRRNPRKGGEGLRTKYGRGWRGKFKGLERAGVIDIT